MPWEFNILDSWDVFLRHVEWMTRIFVIPNFSLSKYCSLLKWGNILPYSVFSTNTWEVGARKSIKIFNPFPAWLLTSWVYPIFSIEYNEIDPISHNNIISPSHPAHPWILTWSSCYDWMAQSVIGHHFRFPDINNQIIILIHRFLLHPFLMHLVDI